MKLKLDEQGNAVLQDGKPVYVHDDGKEVPFDAPGAMAKIASLNAEAKTHREAKEAAEAKLKAFDGIEDAEAAKRRWLRSKTWTIKSWWMPAKWKS